MRLCSFEQHRRLIAARKHFLLVSEIPLESIKRLDVPAATKLLRQASCQPHWHPKAAGTMYTSPAGWAGQAQRAHNMYMQRLLNRQLQLI
jgi:hypothetical protein